MLHTLCRHHGLAGIRQHVDQCEPESFAVGHDRRGLGSELQVNSGPFIVGRRGRGCGVGAQAVDVIFAVLEPDRAREVQYLGDDPIQSRDLLIDTPSGTVDLLRRRTLALERPERRLA